jgi:uncharacterized protein (DUF4415 family)
VKAPNPNLKKVTSSKAARITDKHPEADVKHIIRGIVRNGLKPVQQKSSVSLRLDLDVIDWFRAQGPGYQTRMNAVLKAFRDASV